MATQEDIDAQLVLLQTYRKTLQFQLRKIAMVGAPYAPPELSHGISECRQNIGKIKSTLYSWDYNVEEHPDDKEEVISEENIPRSTIKAKGFPGKSKNAILSQLDQGINLPSFGDIFISKVIDIDETLVLLEIPGFDPEVIPGVIRAENIGGKKYRVGYNARVEVIAVKQTQTGKIAVELAPIFGE